jgi:hypothetical protein
MNQKGMHQFNAQLYIQYELIPQHFVFSGYGGFNRFFSMGNDYTRCLSAYFFGLTAYYYMDKHWSLSANVQSRYRSLFGEMIWNDACSNNISAGYQKDNLSFRLTWELPFQSQGSVADSSIDNRYYSKFTETRNKNRGNQVVFSFSWSFSKGKRSNNATKQLTNEDTDAGIIKN